jgi:peptidyl-dipeptidase Dcp
MSSTNHSNNPFIAAWKNASYGTRDEAVPFDKISDEHFIPALESSLKTARENIQKIKSQTGPATFENTILALETAAEQFESVQSIYFNLFSCEADEKRQALAKEISPMSAAFASEIALDEKLFERIQVVYNQRDSLNLNTEQIRLVEKFFKDFSRNGALLSAENKEKLRKIDQELSVLGPQFSEHLLKATNHFELVLDSKSDLLGLPEGLIEAAAQEAERKGHKGKWFFNLQAPSFVPFMQYAQNRDLRKKLWTAYNSRSFNGDFDNQKIIQKIVHLRHQRAQLLGFKTHAEFVLAERMAQTPDQVMKFINELLLPSKKAAEKDIAELRAFKKTIDGNEEVMPWDFSYLSEKLKEKKFKFSDEELRPYFKLETVIEGVFEHARRLYGITFKEIFDVPKYHQEVRVFEVKEERTQNYIGLFYTDFFPRETKKSGAWMTSYREQGHQAGQVRRPHISIVCNFTKPTASKPSLLTYDEVQTLFHEFGHALHGLLSQCTYRSLSGTNVYWDFVELPSQIMENWVKEKEGLDIFARDYKTGQSIPADLVDKIKKSQQFQAGYYSLRQLQFGILDMAWHSKLHPEDLNVEDVEKTATEVTRLLPRIPGTNMSCSFSHIFAGGYSAGYYSYKWAEVLDADAFEYFKEAGLFNKQVAEKFKSHVLAKGGTEHPMELYKKFRGREPDPKALLRREGLMNL